MHLSHILLLFVHCQNLHGDLMTLSFIIKFAKLVINKRGSHWSLNLSKIRSKKESGVCENAVTRLYGSCMLRVMAPAICYLVFFLF